MKQASPKQLQSSKQLKSYDLLVVITQPPVHHAQNKEALDMALAAGSFGLEVALLFLGAGVLLLQPQQQPEILGLKGSHKTLAALEFYGLEEVFVAAEDLARYALSSENLNLPVTPLHAKSLAALKTRARKVLVF